MKLGGRRIVALPLLVLALLVVVVYVNPATYTEVLVNYTKPVNNDTVVTIDYKIQYALITLQPDGTELILEASKNCSEYTRDISITTLEGRTGVIDVEPGESICRIYLRNKNLLVDYLPPSFIDIETPGVLEVRFMYPTVQGLVRLEFHIEEVVMSVDDGRKGKVRVEWIKPGSVEYVEYECNSPCMLEMKPPSYATSFNVYRVGVDSRILAALTAFIIVVVVSSFRVLR